MVQLAEAHWMSIGREPFSLACSRCAPSPCGSGTSFACLGDRRSRNARTSAGPEPLQVHLCWEHRANSGLAVRAYRVTQVDLPSELGVLGEPCDLPSLSAVYLLKGSVYRRQVCCLTECFTSSPGRFRFDLPEGSSSVLRSKL